MNDQTGASRDAAVKRPEDENLGVTANLMYGLQHVLTMYGGIVAVPLIVAEAAGMSAADAGLLVTACLFMGGVATLLQTLGIPFFGCRLPLVQGFHSQEWPPGSAFCIPAAACRACWGLSCTPRYWA